MQHQSQFVFLVDDDPDMQESIRSLLKSVGLPLESYTTAQDFLDKYDRSKEGCMILDVRMPGMSGLDLQQRMKEKGIDLPIIVVSGHADVPMTVRAIKTGAIDLIEKPFNDQVLLDRIHEGLEENSRRQQQKEESAEVVERMETLTPREKEVLNMVVSGKTNKNIAADLNISRKTLDIHRSKVLQKMKAESIADLVRMVLRQRCYGTSNNHG